MAETPDREARLAEIEARRDRVGDFHVGSEIPERHYEPTQLVQATDYAISPFAVVMSANANLVCAEELTADVAALPEDIDWLLSEIDRLRARQREGEQKVECETCYDMGIVPDNSSSGYPGGEHPTGERPCPDCTAPASQDPELVTEALEDLLYLAETLSSRELPGVSEKIWQATEKIEQAYTEPPAEREPDDG